MAKRKKKKLNIYLDNCCLNRPYDNQSQLRVELETKAKLFIQKLVEKGSVELTVSYILRLENNDNPYDDKKFLISRFFDFAKTSISETAEILKNANSFVDKGLKVHDALHLSCAIEANCDYFFTTDDRLLKFKETRVNIGNPTDFARIWEDYNDDK